MLTSEEHAFNHGDRQTGGSTGGIMLVVTPYIESEQNVVPKMELRILVIEGREFGGLV